MYNFQVPYVVLKQIRTVYRGGQDPQPWLRNFIHDQFKFEKLYLITSIDFKVGSSVRVTTSRNKVLKLLYSAQLTSPALTSNLSAPRHMHDSILRFVSR